MDRNEKNMIKKINKSLVCLPRHTQIELGVQSVQYDDNVFFSGNNIYKKIYVFKPSNLGEKKHEFIKALLSMYDNRFRLSSYIVNKEGKINIYVFFTVYFDCVDYFEARKKITDFETGFKRDVARLLHITFEECSLETILTYVHLNCTGELKEIDTDLLFAKKGVEKIYTDVQVTDSFNIFSCKNVKDRYGSVYLGSIYGDDVSNIIAYFSKNEGTYQYSIEFQRYNDDERAMYQRELKRKYCAESAQLDSDFVNMSFILSVIASDKNELTEIDTRIVDYFKDNGIILSAGTGREKDIYISCASIGLKEFHSMKNVDTRIVSSLLM